MLNGKLQDTWSLGKKNTWLPESFPFKQSIDLGLPWRSGHATDTWLYIEGLIWVIQNGIDQIGYMVVPPELCIWFTNHGNYMITGNFRYHFLIGGLEHFLFFHILGISSSQLTFIFFRGVETTNQFYLSTTNTGYWWLLELCSPP